MLYDIVVYYSVVCIRREDRVNYTFVETTEFTRRIGTLGLEGDLVELQKELNESPKKGDTDPGTGGWRKVRMTDSTRGQAM
jgi:hypothetical protein